MSQLTSSAQRDYDTHCPLSEMGVAAGVKIYGGSALGSLAGYARQLVSGDAFCGFAENNADNTGGAAGAKVVPVRRFGYVKLAVASVAITNIGFDVYATDGNAFNLSGGSYIGKVHRFISAGVCIVSFDLANP